MSERVEVKKGIKFVDSLGVEHDALCTAVHGAYYEGAPEGYQPSINLLYVVGDEKRTDDYGRQTERASSVVFSADQSAHGMFWRFH